MIEHTQNGVPYRWGLSGPQGAWFVLMPLTGDHDSVDVARAKTQLRDSRDVVSLSVEWQEGVTLKEDDNDD